MIAKGLIVTTGILATVVPERVESAGASEWGLFVVVGYSMTDKSSVHR